MNVINVTSENSGGSTFDSASVEHIYICPGNEIRKEQELLELATDKSVIIISSPIAGIVDEICVVKGQKVSADTLLCILREF